MQLVIKCVFCRAELYNGKVGNSHRKTVKLRPCKQCTNKQDPEQYRHGFNDGFKQAIQMEKS